MSESNTPKIEAPTNISVAPDRQNLSLQYADGREEAFTAEFLRVLSPSAEVQGHGPGQAVLQTGKRQVCITAIDSVGRYAIRIVFDDGHNTGLYSWTYFADLAEHRDQLWADYLTALNAAGCTRDD